MSGSRIELTDPDILNPDYGSDYSATVPRATEGCNHVACNLASFFVALIVFEDDDKYVDGDGLGYVYASIYSTTTGE